MALGIRVTFGALATRSQTGMANALSRLYGAQNTLTTGRRIERASDDPGAANQVIRLDAALGDVGQYLRNADQAKNVTQLADSALNSAGELIRDASSVVLQAANSPNNTPEARQALAARLGRIKDQLVGIANTNLNGRYLFAGQRTETRPFDPADAAHVYQGDNGRIRAEINRGEYVTTNVSGDEVFAALLVDLEATGADILAGNLRSLSEVGVAKMADGLKRVLTARGRVGAVGTQIEATRARLDAAQQEFTELRSNLADADMTQAVVDLQAAQNVYQASLASTARTFERSLMDYLR
jgi:flagellar hook-associated protein 3 FlgL